MKIIKKNSLPFLGIAFLLTCISTFINNSYFYKNIEVKSKYEIRNTAEFIHNFSSICMNDYHNQKKCIKNLSTLIRGLKVPYGQEVVLKDSKGKLLLFEDSRTNKKREAIHLSDDKDAFDLQNLDVFKSKIEISKNIIPSIPKTVWNSMTLSLLKVTSLWQKEGYNEAKNYFKTVAWPRSRPAIWFFLISLIIVSLSNSVITKMRLKYEQKQKLQKEKHLLEIKRQENVIRKKQKKINAIHKSLVTLHEEHNTKLNNENTKFRKILQKLVKQKSKILDDAFFIALKQNFEIDQKQRKNNELVKEIQKLEVERNQRESEIEEDEKHLQTYRNISSTQENNTLVKLFGKDFNHKLKVKILGEFDSDKKALEKELKQSLKLANLTKLTIDHSDNKELKSKDVLKQLKKGQSSYDFVIV